MRTVNIGVCSETDRATEMVSDVESVIDSYENAEILEDFESRDLNSCYGATIEVANPSYEDLVQDLKSVMEECTDCEVAVVEDMYQSDMTVHAECK